MAVTLECVCVCVCSLTFNTSRHDFLVLTQNLNAFLSRLLMVRILHGNYRYR